MVPSAARPNGPMVARFVLAMGAEAVFLAGRTWILGHYPAGVAQELAWSAWRLPFIAIYFSLALPFIAERREQRPLPRHPLLAAVILLSMADVVLARDLDLDFRLVLAATAALPAVREELFYRTIVQGFLEKVVHPVAAITISASIFTAYHYGSQPMHAVSVSGIFAAGIVLGVIYQRTRSVRVVAVLHTLIDVAYALMPALAVAPGALVLCNVLAVMGALVWWKIDRSPPAA